MTETQRSEVASPTFAPAVTRGSRVLLIGFAVALAIVTLVPGEENGANSVIAAMADWLSGFGVPYVTAFNGLEFLANIVMFVPLGLLLPLAFGSARPRVLWLTVTAGLLLSMGIEFAQRTIPGRVSDPRDLVSNTLGAALGVLLLALLSNEARNRG